MAFWILVVVGSVEDDGRDLLRMATDTEVSRSQENFPALPRRDRVSSIHVIWGRVYSERPGFSLPP